MHLKKILTFLLPVFLIIIVGFLVFSVYKPLPLIQSTSLIPASTLENSQTVAWGPYGSQNIGIVGYGINNQTGTQTPTPIASTIKILLTLCVLNIKPLGVNEQGPNIIITPTDVADYNTDITLGESVVKVQAGEVISEYQALQALLIASANNFADILANWAFGSSSKYLDYANQYVQSHGMNSTTINDTSGFSTSTVSNSNNLEILGQKAITNPVIANIVDQYTAIIPVAGKIVNYNFNLNPSSKSQINGIKTGNTSAGGGNYIYSTDYLGYKLVGSIVNAPNLNDALDEAPAILNSYEKLINNKTIVSKDQVVGYYSLPWGNKIQVYSNKSILVPVEPNTKYKIDLKLGNYIPSKQISDYIVVSNNSVSIKYPLTIQNNYTNPSIWWRINYSFKKMF